MPVSALHFIYKFPCKFNVHKEQNRREHQKLDTKTKANDQSFQVKQTNKKAGAETLELLVVDI